jgi:hypothetical protein
VSLALAIAVHDITPAPGLPMGGYAARTAPAQATLDPLTCRVAVVRAGGQTAALVVLDLLYVRDPWATATRRRIAQRLRTEPAAVMIAATHTHAGPAVFGAAMKESRELADYQQRLSDIIDGAVENAAATLRAVTLHYGMAATAGVAANRQERQRDFDAAVRVILARDEDGQAAGVIASFGCHPTVLPASNLAYSRDLFGAAVDCVEREIAAPVVLLNGAAADVSTRFTRRTQTPEEVERLGGQLATGILAAIGNARHLADAPISGRSVEVGLEARPRPTLAEAQARLADAMNRCEQARGHVAEAELRRLTADVEGAAAQLYFSQQGGTEALLGRVPNRVHLQTLRISGCDILGIPGEMFSVVGRDLCSRRAQPALLAGYANDYIGYLVPPGASEGYESVMSFVTEASAAAIADALAGSGEDAQA